MKPTPTRPLPEGACTGLSPCPYLCASRSSHINCTGSKTSSRPHAKFKLF
jgi:hypothetical protein